MPPNTLRVHTEYVLVKSVGPYSLVGLITSAGTGEYFPPLQFTCRNCGGGDRGRVAIYHPFGEFHRAKSHCHLYGAQGQRKRTSFPCPDKFRGPRSDYVRQVASENNNNNRIIVP
ncbi:uncharacterized protein TNCV_378711 [Trichonephila clavipes]|nr:uncharacterized protein TNCV_378711 [Trichonephila clavipes]